MSINKNKRPKQRVACPKPGRAESTESKLVLVYKVGSPDYDRPLFPKTDTWRDAEAVRQKAPLQIEILKTSNRNAELKNEPSAPGNKTDRDVKSHTTEAKQQNEDATATAESGPEKNPETKMAKSKNGILMRKPVPQQDEFEAKKKSQNPETAQAVAERQQDRDVKSQMPEADQKKPTPAAKQQTEDATVTAESGSERNPESKVAKSKNRTLMRKQVTQQEAFPATVKESQNKETAQAEAERHQANTELNPGGSGRAAKHPEFEELDKRMKSFTDMFEAEAEDFAKCGYFLKGNGVTCFYCGNSPVEDKKIPDHIVGHWKYNPECKAANLSFAEQFVDIHSNETEFRPIETVIPEKACFDNTATIEEENRRLKGELKCEICSEIKDAVFIPCGDNIFCMECATKIIVCPKCSKQIENRIQVIRTDCEMKPLTSLQKILD